MAISFLLLVIVLILAESKRLEKKIMISLDVLAAKIEAVAAVVPNIEADYKMLKAAIDELKSQVDPEAQAKVDALVAKLDASLSALKVVDDSVPEPVVEDVPVVE